MNLNPVNRLSGHNRESDPDLKTDVNPEIRKGSAQQLNRGEDYRLEGATSGQVWPSTTKAQPGPRYKEFNYFEPHPEHQALLGKANVQKVDQTLSSMGQIQRFKGGNCLGPQSGQQQAGQQEAKTSSKSVPEQPRQLAPLSEGQGVQIGPQRLALHCGDASGQQVDQDLSQMVLIQDDPKLNFEEQREAVYKECYVISSALKSKGYGAKKPIPPKNADTGDKLRQDWAPGQTRQLSFREKLASCCEAFCEACIRCISFRNPSG